MEDIDISQDIAGNGRGIKHKNSITEDAVQTILKCESKSNGVTGIEHNC